MEPRSSGTGAPPVFGADAARGFSGPGDRIALTAARTWAPCPRRRDGEAHGGAAAVAAAMPISNIVTESQHFRNCRQNCLRRTDPPAPYTLGNHYNLYNNYHPYLSVVCPSVRLTKETLIIT